MEAQAASLVSAALPVLLINLHTYSSSDGDTSAFSISVAYHVVGTVVYLFSRGEIDPDKISVPGLSLGAPGALYGELQSKAIRALGLEVLEPADVQARIVPGNYIAKIDE